MPRVSLIQVIFNHRRFIEPVFKAVFNQTYKDSEFVVVIAGNEDGGKELIQEKFPQVRIIDPGYNIGFAKGHNEFFAGSNSEFFQLVNPDLILEPTYVEEMVKAMDADPKAGAATGKLLRYDFVANKPLDIIDSTGVLYAKTGRGRDRGQHEVDHGQYDNQTRVIAVSGAGPMYRKSALEDVKMPRDDNHFEYYDEDFHSYWEDVDLGLRMTNAGWHSIFVPNALAYHGRGAGSSPGGYKKVWSFMKHHSKISSQIRKWNYRNHLFLYLKNMPTFYPQFFVREFFMLGYIILLETATLSVIPQIFKMLPKMWRKRKLIQRQRKISVAEFKKLLV